MKSNEKIFEYLVFPEDDNPSEHQASFTVNQSTGMIEYSFGSSKEALDGFWSYLYEFRILGPGSAETRLREAKYTPNVSDDIQWDVLDGQVMEERIYKRFGKEWGSERVNEKQAAVLWHLETDPAVLLCIFHGDEEGTKKIRDELLSTRKKIEAGERLVSSVLKERFGNALEIDKKGAPYWVSLPKGLAPELSVWFQATQPRDYGFDDWWRDYMGFRERLRILDGLYAGTILRLISADVWVSELVELETARGLKSIFRNQKENHYFTFLDGRYLESQLSNWIREALRGQDVNEASDYFEKYGDFLKEVDWGLGHESEVSLEPKFSFPYYARAAELEGPAGVYLSQKEWQNDYLDWVLIGAFIRMEEVSFRREVEKGLKQIGFIARLVHKDKIEKITQILSSLGKLSQLVTSKTFSVKDVLAKCEETRNNQGFVHPCVIALLENRISQGKPFVVFPVAARTPNEMEQDFIYRKKNKPAKAG